jgi:CheY-like chemotaxis protein
MKTAPLILFIDDDSFHISIYGKKFEAMGCRVVSTRNGADGLRMARKHRPDLIILGLVMPGLNGFEVLESLKAEPEFERIPVIVMTSLAHETDVRRCQKLGCAAYLIKSQTKPEDVMKKVSEILRISA